VFTGDSSGDFLYKALHKAGFANQPDSTAIGDGLELKDMYIAAVCRCAPPENKPAPEEIGNCLSYLVQEIHLLDRLEVIVALGRIAFDNTLRIYRTAGYAIPRTDFTHGHIYQFDKDLPTMIASYHPSRQNTQTRRLTEEMFSEVWVKAQSLLK
jgi:uracil-DNA glycosylase family 4